ncbi:ribonuclease T [Erythrobacter mangrovi]|uniref:Ribonuclease T n=1 Tax=Erythrobacter mangrovi TaxID=2739433 RepID=A0A7D3XTS6_9SPHN|nr:ribonuclease T [Erythrobacter mangrovi]
MKSGAANWLKGCALAALLASPAGSAGAQSYQCRLPASVELPQLSPDGPVRRLPVTGYTLALSWSPEFCRGRENEVRHKRQCSGRAGRFGMVVHGLWPESGRSWPQWCPIQSPLSVEAVRPNLCLSPSTSLVVNQWAKHGSCMTRRPETYFRVTRILWSGLRMPDFDRISREEGLTAGTIRTRFTDANPGWRSEAVGVHLNRRGWLEEIQLCYDRRFMPTACDRGRRGESDDAPAKIWRGF